MPLTLDERCLQTLADLNYFHEGDPALEKCIQHLWRMSFDVRGKLRLLIHGETGTGKEALATAAHRWKTTAPGRFISVNCATINESTAMADLFGTKRGAFTGSYEDRPGFFGVAPEDKGTTIFLDEIDRIPVSVRASLLRVVAEGTYYVLGDTRKERHYEGNIFTASSLSISAVRSEKGFPHDLYFRLIEGGEVRVPSLAERSLSYRNALIDFGCEHWGLRKFSVDTDLRNKLLAWNYHGNVRELKGILHQLSKYARFTNGLATAEQFDSIIDHRASSHGRSIGMTYGEAI